ncbi:MAG TPA: hypothetical protein VIM12_11320 [Noviherbaspirillum sp.]|jgi:hypothetical protein|uniref:hypothetical protein n=1 Tax=Noviherbaspirillum sp. TaxID=1926288 RepID=UPI002F943585
MRYALIGKCSGCGRKNDWNDTECPGCHVKRRPWLTVATLLATLLLTVGAMAVSA